MPIVYPNGYSNRIVGSVSRLLLPASHAGFPLFIRRQHNDLRLVASGGLVQTGFDFKVESLAEVDYPYHIHRYDGSIGLLEMIIHLPLTANAQNLFAIYFNKVGVLASQEDRARSWNNKALAIYHLPSLLDYSGNGRDLEGAVPTYVIADALAAAAADNAAYFDSIMPPSIGKFAPFTSPPVPPSQRAGWSSQTVLPGIVSGDHGSLISSVITVGRFPTLDSGAMRNDDNRGTVAQAPDGTNATIRYRHQASYTPPDSVVEWHMKDFPSGLQYLAIEGEVWWQATFDWGSPVTDPTNGGKFGLGLYIGSHLLSSGHTPPEKQAGVSIRNIWSNGTPANPNQFAGRCVLYTYSFNRRVARDTDGTNDMEGKKIGSTVAIAWPRGRWVKFSYEVQLNNPGVCNGYTRMYLDGVLVSEETQAVYTLDGSWKILGAMFSDAWNTGNSPQDQSTYLRNVKYWRQITDTEYTYDLELTTNRAIPNTTGADLWPSTWASNGNVYATFGDGPNTNGVSCGLAIITGTTLATLAVTWIVGGPSPVIDHWSPIAGYGSDGTQLLAKCTSLIAFENNLYLWLADDDNERGWTDCRIAKVSLSNIAAGPLVPSWGMGGKGTLHTWKTINPAFLQCGRNMDDGWDDYVYAFPQHYAPIENPPGDSPSHNPAQFYLMRCLKTNDWQVQANWQWWTGGTDDAPTWGAYGSRQARITMTGQCDWRPSAHYIKLPVDRCIFRIGRTGDLDFGGGSMSRFGTFIAQRPWHDWTLIGDEQYLASTIAADLAQVSAIPSTISIKVDGSVEWFDSVWGGTGEDGLGGATVYDSDKFIATKSILTPTP